MDIQDLLDILQGKMKQTSTNPYAQMMTNMVNKTSKKAAKAGDKSYAAMKAAADIAFPLTEATNIAEGKGKPADWGWMAANFAPVGKIGKGVKAGAKATKAAAGSVDDLLRAFARMVTK